MGETQGGDWWESTTGWFLPETDMDDTGECYGLWSLHLEVQNHSFVLMAWWGTDARY